MLELEPYFSLTQIKPKPHLPSTNLIQCPKSQISPFACDHCINHKRFFPLFIIIPRGLRKLEARASNFLLSLTNVDFQPTFLLTTPSFRNHRAFYLFLVLKQESSLSQPNRNCESSHFVSLPSTLLSFILLIAITSSY